jgi:hypothetical protein
MENQIARGSVNEMLITQHSRKLGIMKKTIEIPCLSEKELALPKSKRSTTELAPHDGHHLVF